jgi:hypothetical protein
VAITITIDYDDTHTRVRVVEDSGRDQTATAKRYPDPESTDYCRFINALDSFMYEFDDRRVCKHISPACGPDGCGEEDE